MNEPDLFAHAEADLVKTLGLSADALKATRKKLKRGADWDVVRGFIRYSSDGRSKLFLALKIPAAGEPAPTPDEKKETDGPLQPGARRELVCVRTFALNKRIVYAKFGDAPQRVRLKDSANLRPGMTMTCALVRDDLWELAQRLPRWPGKW